MGRENHVSEFSNSEQPDPELATVPIVQTMVAELGYRYVLNQASVAHDRRGGTHLHRVGQLDKRRDAPVYTNHDVFIKIGNTVIDTGRNLKGVLPGSWQDNLSVNLAGIAAADIFSTDGVGTGLDGPGYCFGDPRRDE